VTGTATPPLAPAPEPSAEHREPAAGEPPAPPARPKRTEPVRRVVRRHESWVLRVFELLVLAGLAFIPLVVVKQGVVTSDTKTYLYLDPGRFLSQVGDMWNPTVGLGTVTHEYIGYLLPMGPFYALMSDWHVPVWVAQRLWLGGILFAAGAGVRYLCRVLGMHGPGRLVAALAYMLSPYFLQYAGRISVILLPWAGLPWLVAFVVLALRRGGWRYPALFAIVAAIVSGINASSIIYVGVAPVLWLVYAVVAERDARWRDAGWTALKVGGLTFLCCLWWVVGLQVEAAYGVDVLRYTETIPATSATSSASEVVRGLGYWYFYGGDRLGPWTQSAVIYTQQIWLLAASYAVPFLAFVSAVFVRWRHRAYFVLLVVVGMVLSVGAHPFDSPTPVGGLLKRFMTDTTAGLAMRSTDRATPLVLLGLTVLLGAGVSALWRRLPLLGMATAGVAIALVIANNPAIFNGDAEVASFFVQPAKLPAYEMQAIDHLNATHPGTRVLAIPGNDFAAYRWGDTIDTPQPAFLTRPFVTREQQVMGSMATADTLYAMDEPVQEGIENWTALAPMARLLSAGDVLVEYDQAFEHYNVPQPKLLAHSIAQATPPGQFGPPGLTDPVFYGTPIPNVAKIPTLEEADLAAPANLPNPPPLASYSVTAPRPLTRGESDAGAVIVAGDAVGLQAMAAAGMLDTNSALYYAGTLDTHPAQLRSLLSSGAALVVTDSNRKEAFQWDTLTANYGETETPSENPARHDLKDSPIELFPGSPRSAKSIAAYIGAADVTASSFGNTVSYTPEDRAANAVDGSLDTSWETGTFVPNPSGQWWQIAFPPTSAPVTASQVTVVQPQTGDLSRWITRATLTFDGAQPVTVGLGPASRTPSGQVIPFPQRAFHSLRLTIDATSNDHAPQASASAVGLAEMQIPGVSVTDVVGMPSDLLDAAGPASIANRVTFVMSRERVSPYPPRTDPEATIDRVFTLPTARTFSVSGNASISALIPDDQIDRLVGRPVSGGGVVGYSNGRMPGCLTCGAAAAIDGNPATAWQPGWGAAHQQGDWLHYDLPKAITFDHMNLQILADHQHSVPTSITVTTEQGTRAVVLPPIHDGTTPGSTVTVPITFPAITGAHVQITFTGVRLQYTTNYINATPIALPLGVAELGIPGLQAAPVPAAVPASCRTNIVSIDGKPVGIEITGNSQSALEGGEISFSTCGPSAKGVTLAPGLHVVETSAGHSTLTGWNVDQLVLDSAPGGTAAPAGPGGTVPATQPGPVPLVTTTAPGTTGESASVAGAAAPFELVLGQSVNAGWQAVAHPGPGAVPDAHSVNLGPSELVDGFANGWQVSAADLATLGGPNFTVSITWAPQGKVWAAVAVSVAAILLCLLLAILPRSWWRGARRGVGATARRVTRRGLDAAVSEATAANGNSKGALARLEPDPVLSWPFASRGRRPPLWAAVLIAGATGGAAAVITAPLIGLAVGLATAAAILVPLGRAVTSLAAVGLFAAAAVSVVHGQLTHPVAEGPNWASAYETAALLVWMAVVFLGADAVADVARRLARRRGQRG